MEFEVQVAHSITEIGQEAWDRLGGEHMFASYRWYRFGEAVLAPDTPPTYIVLSRKGEPVARGTFWLSGEEFVPLPPGVLRRLIEAAMRCRPLLMCRSPLANAPGLVLPEPPLHDAALRTLAQVVLEEARRRRVSFLIFGHLEHRRAHDAAWPEGFVPVRLPDPGTRLVVAWPDFESYLAALSKSVRKDYRRHRNRAADLGIVVTRCRVTGPLDGALLDRAMALIRNVENHHRLPHYRWARAILQNAHLVDAAWLTAEIGERLVGCGLLLGDRGVWCLASLGLDYECDYVYFQLLYEAIRCAIEEGDIHVLRGGSEVYEMKQRLGFHLEDSHHLVFAGAGALPRMLGRWLTRRIVRAGPVGIAEEAADEL